MTKVITDKKKIEEVLTRGVENVFPDIESFRGLLESGKRIRLYCGFDPTAPSLHLGNAIAINKLAQFQELGHEVIFLIGSFTCMIGDPTDKLATRKKMTREEILANSKHYQKQASTYLDFKGKNPAKVMYNSEWGDKLTFRDLIELSSNFTVQQMIQRDMFQKRLKDKKPIYLHEFLYPLAQAYDAVAMDVDLEIGGNDQMFNMMCGRDLMGALGMRNKYVMTLNIFQDDKGTKMGKTEGNAVFLNEDPSNMYGIIMSWPDGFISPGFELVTILDMGEVKKYQEELKDEKTNPRDLKMKLAFEIVKLICGEKKANEAQEQFIKTVQNKEVPDEIELLKLEIGNWKLADLLLEVRLASSKSEARRLIKQGGIKINEKVVNDENMEVNIEKEVLLQRGKRQFLKVIKK